MADDKNQERPRPAPSSTPPAAGRPIAMPLESITRGAELKTTLAREIARLFGRDGRPRE